MGQFQRALHMDVSNTVDVSDPVAVEHAVKYIIGGRYEGFDLSSVGVLFRDFSRLYEGRLPGYRACDIKYHNAQHVLDVTLAMARLVDGLGATQPLEPNMALAGIAAALFHDSGYIRRTRDSRNKNGGAYTRSHVSRSARFIAEYLPQVGLEYLVGTCTRIVHFTRHDIEPCQLAVANDQEYVLGTLLGTADLIAQMADIDYIRKCREHLYEEFVAGGIASDGDEGEEGNTATKYRSPEQLLRLTPGFMRDAIDIRLDGHFDRVHRYAAEHFGGRHLYMEAIQQNCSGLEELLARSES
jgi:hypothetical protein